LSYSYITLAQLQAALLQRLQDTSAIFTTSAEAQLYLTEALRVLNAQAALWNAEFQVGFNTGDTWKSLNYSGSPRQRTVTDTSLYTEMQYHLLEPPTGGTWTGTNQFNITNISNALQYRRDELLLASGANLVNITTINSPVAGVTTALPDTILDLRRVRWIPTFGNPYALFREDIRSVNAYGDQLSLRPGSPDSWLITANTPLNFDIDRTPNVPGMWDLLAMESGASLAPPSSTILGLPDDWCWVAKYGALADCLSNSPEATDIPRAKYCQQRFERGMKAMMSLPWLVDATIANLPVDTPSFEEMDAYRQNWENVQSPFDPQIVVGGMDLIALAPFISTNGGFGMGGFGGGGFGMGGFGGGGLGGSGLPVSGVLTVVGNAPIPSLSTDNIQLSRDGLEAVLGYAQHIAMFKCGGADFANTLPLLKQFDDYCALQNRRYSALGINRKEMILEGSRGNDLDPLFAPEYKGRQ